MPTTNSANEETILIDIPNELIEFGKILLIEKASEVYIDGFHLTRPRHPIRENHHLCLIDLQHHLAEESISKDRNRIESLLQRILSIRRETFSRLDLFQLIIQLNPDFLRQGKSIEIQRSEEKDSAEDLTEQKGKKEAIKIHLNGKTLQRGWIRLIERGKSSFIEGKDFSNDSKYHWNKNLFTIQDYLRANQSMQLTIAIEPEFFREGLRITLKKEDAKSISTHFPYRRPSRVSMEEQLKLTKTPTTLEEFLYQQSQWNPKLLNDNHLLQLSIDLRKSPQKIEKEDQMKISTADDNSLRIEMVSSTGHPALLIEPIFFPRQVQSHQFKSHLDLQRQVLSLSIPLINH